MDHVRHLHDHSPLFRHLCCHFRLYTYLLAHHRAVYPSCAMNLPAALDPLNQVSIRNNPHILSFLLSNQYLQLQSSASSMPHCTIRTSPGGMEGSRPTPGLSLNSCFFGFIALLLSCVLFLAACFLRVYFHDITNATPTPDRATYILFSPNKTWTLTTYPAHD